MENNVKSLTNEFKMLTLDKQIKVLIEDAKNTSTLDKYQDKFTPAELHNMYSGNFAANDDVMNMLAGLNNTKLRESFIYGGVGEKLNQLDKKTLDIFKDYVNNCEITERDVYDFSRDFYNFDFEIFVI